MTLSEMLVVLAIMGIILAALAGVLSMSITQSSQIQEHSVLQTEVRNTVDTMARELRQAYTGDSTYPIVTATSTTLMFYSPDKAVPFHNRLHRLPARRRADRPGSDDEHRHRRASLDGFRVDVVRLDPVGLVGEAGRLGQEQRRLHLLQLDRHAAHGHDHAVVRVPGPDHGHGGDEGRLHAAVHLLHERQPEVEARMTRQPRSLVVREDGIAMVLVVIIAAFMTLLAVTLIDVVRAESDRGAHANWSNTAFEAAEAGLDDYISKLVDDHGFYLHYVHPAESTRSPDGSIIAPHSSDCVAPTYSAKTHHRRGLGATRRRGRTRTARTTGASCRTASTTTCRSTRPARPTTPRRRCAWSPPGAGR